MNQINKVKDIHFIMETVYSIMVQFNKLKLNIQYLGQLSKIY